MTAIRTNATFRSGKFSVTDPIPGAEPYDQDLGGDCAQWLIANLPSRGFEMDAEPVQEDWGWVAIASRDSLRFWVGVSPMDLRDPAEWILHVHHWDFAIWQRLSKIGRIALAGLAMAIDGLLRCDPEIRDVRWHFEKEVLKNHFDLWSASPCDSELRR